MCSINWTKSRGHILFHKILSKRSPWALKDEEPCLFYCTDTPNSLGGMRLLISSVTSELFKFENWPSLVPAKIKIYFHVSLAFLVLTAEYKPLGYY